jgi:hypothetical protein
MEANALGEVGLSRAEFWELTPRQWAAIWERYCDKEIRHERRFGMLAMLKANLDSDRRKHPQPYSIEDFAPALRGAKAPQPFTVQPLEVQLGLMKAAHAMSAATGKGVGAWGKLSDEEYAELFPDRPPRSVH